MFSYCPRLQDNWVVFEATFVETFSKFFVKVESTFRAKPARSLIETEFDDISDDTTTESPTTPPMSEDDEHPVNEVEVEPIDEDTVTDKPKKNKSREGRNFSFF